METAGRAVVFSGTAVAIGLALLAMPLPFIRGFGVAGLTIPIVSVICAVTLLPVLLYLTADGLDRVRLVPRRLLERREDTEQGFWMRLAHAIMRQPARSRRVASRCCSRWPSRPSGSRWARGRTRGSRRDLESTRALTILGDAAGDGATAPTEIVIDTGPGRRAPDPAVLAAVDALGRASRPIRRRLQS